jgi:hypothetical protein
MTTVVLAVDHDTNETLTIERVGLVDFSNNFFPTFKDSASQSSFNGASVPSRVIHLILRRAALAKAFALVIFGVNWGLTAMVLYLSLAGIQRGSDLSEGDLFFPATIILTVPSLRALMVGNPPFGTFLGHFLNDLFFIELLTLGILLGKIILFSMPQHVEPMF